MLKCLSFSWEPRETENIFLMCFHNIFSHALSLLFFSVSLSDCPPLNMSPDVLGPGSSWQCHPGFSRLSRCCCWWRCDNDYLGTSFFFSPCVSCALLFFLFFPLCCWSQDQICCRCLHHPSHLATSESVEIMLVLHMCRYALGVRVFFVFKLLCIWERVSTKSFFAVSL